MAEANAERRDSSNAPIVDLDDLDDKPLQSLLRLRGLRIGRLVVSVVAVPTGWLLAASLPGLLPILGLALCVAGTLSALLTIYLIAHVQRAIAAARYEASFTSPQE